MVDFGFSEAQLIKNDNLSELDDEPQKPAKKFKNIETFTLNITKNYFIIQSNKTKLQLNNRLVIERDNKSSKRIYEIGSSEKFMETPYKKRQISAFLGIVNILEKQFLLVVNDVSKICEFDAQDIYLIGGTSLIRFDNDKFSDNQERDYLLYYQSFQKLLVQGYYFSFAKDLTLNKQKSLNQSFSSEIKFFWNHYIARSILSQSVTSTWIQKLIQGYIGYFQTTFDNKKLDYYLISRRSCLKAGTRYNARGIDDEGSVANYVESEQIIYYNDKCYSHIQIRGSVPIFWQQRGLTAQTQITRPLEMAQSSYLKHFGDINLNYGKVICINLMARHKPGEQCLTNAYEKLIQKTNLPQVKYHFFDFHVECKGQKFYKINPLIHKLKPIVDCFKFFVYELKTKNILQHQVGTVRTNCLDCLDRTNVCQGKIAAIAFDAIMKFSGVDINKLLNRTIIEEMDDNNINNQHQFTLNFKTLWADNGDFISMHYSGTGSVISSVTRTGKPGLLGLLDHGMKTLNRFYIGNFEDQIKQECIDMLLGQHTETVNVFNEEVQRRLQERARDYCTFGKLNILIVTWSVCGFIPGHNYNFQNLFDTENNSDPDIIIIGLQDLVDLNPKNVLSTTNITQQWKSVLSSNIQKKQSKYHLIRDSDLVGLSIFIYGRDEISKRITKIEIDKIKTGYQGTLGNKGAIAFKLYVDDTSICFINCHLEANEQHNQFRLQNIHEIHTKAFQLDGVGKKKHDKIETYDYKFLFGNLNFRLTGDSIDNIKSLINSHQNYIKDNNISRAQDVIQKLIKYDQLSKSKQYSEYLSKYNEGIITFLPSYKFQPNSENYDFNKKSRLPSWCDRILFWNDESCIIQQIYYTTKNYLESDHRPVASYFSIEIKKADPVKKEQIIKQFTEEAPLIMAMEDSDLVTPDNQDIPEEELENENKRI